MIGIPMVESILVMVRIWASVVYSFFTGEVIVLVLIVEDGRDNEPLVRFFFSLPLFREVMTNAEAVMESARPTHNNVLFFLFCASSS